MGVSGAHRSNIMEKEVGDMTQVVDSCDYWTVILIGFLTFTTVNYLTKFVIPAKACHNPQQRWKWRNVATSFLHSLITGIWAPICFYQAPEMQDDLIRTFTYSSHVLVSFSIGYFLYDALDMMLYHRKRSSYELMLHHFSVVFCYSLAVISQEYIAYGALSLIVEINSIFLHARQLFIITHEPKSSLRYKANALLNVGTFVACRILLLGWMARWLTEHRDEIPLFFFTAGSLGLAIIVVMNPILFYRILSVDFSGIFRSASFTPREQKECSTGQESIGSYIRNVFQDEDKLHSARKPHD